MTCLLRLPGRHRNVGKPLHQARRLKTCHRFADSRCWHLATWKSTDFTIGLGKWCSKFPVYLFCYFSYLALFVNQAKFWLTSVACKTCDLQEPTSECYRYFSPSLFDTSHPRWISKDSNTSTIIIHDSWKQGYQVTKIMIWLIERLCDSSAV